LPRRRRDDELGHLPRSDELLDATYCKAGEQPAISAWEVSVSTVGPPAETMTCRAFSRLGAGPVAAGPPRIGKSGFSGVARPTSGRDYASASRMERSALIADAVWVFTDPRLMPMTEAICTSLISP